MPDPISRAQRWTLIAAIIGSGTVFLDSTVVTVALPRIAADLPTDRIGALEAQSYVYNAYLLALGSLLVLAGALSDYHGRRRLFLLGLFGFGAASVLCGLAPTMELLIAARILQGAAGAILVPGSLSILTETFTGERRGWAIGIWAGASAATTILGPFVGGVLVDAVSWRMAFLVNVPLIAVALLATAAHVAESRDEQASGNFDWAGAAVIALAVGGLSFGAIRGQERQWADPTAFAALAVGAVALLAFVPLQSRRAHPLVPLRLFANRNFAVTNASTLLIYGALYVTGYIQAIFLQGTIGYNAAAAGLTFLPASILLALFSARVGALAGRLGPRRFMAAGPLVMAAGLLWLLRMPADSDPWRVSLSEPATLLPPTGFLVDVLPAMVVFGIGLVVMVAPLTTALMSSVPVRHAGLASAINNAISRVGPQLAGALVFVAVTAAFYGGIAERAPGVDVGDAGLRSDVAPLNAPAPGADPTVVAAARDASTAAFRLAMALGAGLLLAGGVVNAVGIRDEELVGLPGAAAADS